MERMTFVGVCLIILGLMLKLYTEMLKDSAMNARNIIKPEGER